MFSGSPHSFRGSNAQVSLSSFPSLNTSRSTFNRSHKHSTTINDDAIYPIFVDEVVPGDTFNIGVNSFIRMMPTATPFMDNITCDIFAFFVPNRLTWNNWQKFMGEQTDPEDSIDFLVPQLVNYDLLSPPTPLPGFGLHTLTDYMGVPVAPTLQTANMPSINALPNRGLNLIWNEWFRDQNLQDSLNVPKGDGPDTAHSGSSLSAAFSNNLPMFRSKRKDYFTSALPWPQKGESVPLPSSDSVPVLGIGVFNQTFSGGSNLVYESDGTSTTYTSSRKIDPAANSTTVFIEKQDGVSYPNIRADLSANTEATINALRTAFQLQKFLERDARGGTRYIELIRSHFGVISSDARLQRPEFLHHSSFKIMVSPLPQTSESGTTTQGNLAGNGIGTQSNAHFSKAFEEHGFVFILASLRGDVSYSQGLNRMWSRETRYDYLWPEFAHLGEQAILKKEVLAMTSGDEDVFGYAPRYDEYRYKESRVTNLQRPGVAGSLAVWNLSQELAGVPALGTDFITSQTPLDRVLLAPSQPAFMADFWFDYKCTRPLPTHGTPGFADHF